MREDTYSRKLIDYIKKNIKKGYPAESLKWALVNQGYARIIVEGAIEKAHKEMADQAPILKEKPKIRYEVIDEHDNPVVIKRSWWKRWLGV